MKQPSPAQHRALRIAAKSPLGALIRPGTDDWIPNQWTADPDMAPNVLHIAIMACVKNGWMEPVQTHLEHMRGQFRVVKLTAYGRTILGPEYLDVAKVNTGIEHQAPQWGGLGK